MTRTAAHRPGASQPQRGQALAEFALVSPIFFLVLFGIIQLGLIFGGQNGLVSASRELARYAAPYHVGTGADATAVCANASSDHGLGSQLTESMQAAIPGYAAANVATRQITYSWHPNPTSSGGAATYYVQLEIHVAYKFPLYVPLISAVLDGFDGVTDNKLKLDATEQMRIENLGLTSSSSSVTCSI